MSFGGIFLEYKRIFSTDEIKFILSELVAEYDKTSGEPLTILIVGGSAAIFHFDFKKDTKEKDNPLTTNDIENYFEEITFPCYITRIYNLQAGNLDFGARDKANNAAYNSNPCIVPYDFLPMRGNF